MSETNKTIVKGFVEEYQGENDSTCCTKRFPRNW